MSNKNYKKPQFHVVYGKHSVDAVLQNPRRIIYKLFLDYDSKFEVPDDLRHEYVSRQTLEKMCRDGDKHQGIVAHVSSLIQDFDLKAYLKMFSSNQISKIVILDSINDPHNIGAILRSARCFGIDLIILPIHGSPDINSSVIRSSAGMSEYINILYVTNLNSAIASIKEYNYFTACLSAGGSVDLKNISKQDRVCIVLGSEGRGVRESVEKSCDALVSIQMIDGAESLNVSNAAAIAFYELF